MFRPDVRYARADDGVAIAFSRVGDGPVPIVMATPLLGQLEVAWEEPAFEGFVSRLAVGATVVLFDRRGSGLSDHVAYDDGQLTLERLAADVEAVLNAISVDRAVVIGISMGAFTAVQFAATRAHRTSALIVFGGMAGPSLDAGNPIGLEAGEVPEWFESTVQAWGSGSTVEYDGPTMARNPRYRTWAARLERHTLSPSQFAAALRATFGYDLRRILPLVGVPTLILHRTDDHAVHVDNGRFLAEHIPGARFVEIPGVEHAYFLGDQGLVLGAIREFVDQHVAGGALRTAVRDAERADAYGFGWDSLSPGEREVAVLVASGLTNVDVARRLEVSPFTVDGRLRRVFAKLGVSSRVELTAEYARTVRT